MSEPTPHRTMRAYKNPFSPALIIQRRIENVPQPLNTDTIKALVGYDSRKSNKRYQELVLPRQIGMVMAYLFTEKTATSAAKAFGKDHSTLLYAVKQITVAAKLKDPLIMPDLLRVYRFLYKRHCSNLRIYRYLTAREQMAVDHVNMMLEKSDLVQTLKLIK